MTLEELRKAPGTIGSKASITMVADDVSKVAIKCKAARVNSYILLEIAANSHLVNIISIDDSIRILGRYLLS